MEKLQSSLETLKHHKDKLRCNTHTRLPVAINTGDIDVDRLMCTKCLIKYHADFEERELDIVPIDEFIDVIQMAIDHDGRCGMSRDQIDEKLVDIFQSLLENTLKETLPVIKSAVEACRNQLVDNIQRSVEELSKLENSTNLHEMSPGHALLKAHQILSSNKQLQVNQEVQKLNDEIEPKNLKSDGMNNEIQEEASRITGKCFASAGNLMPFCQELIPHYDCSKRFRDQTSAHYYIERGMIYFSIQPLVHCYFHGFSMGKLYSGSSFAEVKLYRGIEIDEASLIACVEVDIPQFSTKDLQIYSQTPNSAAIMFGKPYHFDRRETFTIGIEIFPQSSKGVEMVMGKCDVIKGSYINTTLYRNAYGNTALFAPHDDDKSGLMRDKSSPIFDLFITDIDALYRC